MCGGLQGGRALKNRRKGSPAGPRSAGGFSGPALTSVLPEGSCTELPRGRSLCPARGSSVQDASGWESAGSKEAWWPQHRTNQVLGVSAPPQGLALGQEESRLRLSAFSKKQGRCLPRRAGSGLPNIPQHLGRKKKKRTAYPVIG